MSLRQAPDTGNNPPTREPARWGTWFRLAGFLAGFSALQGLYSAHTGGAVERWVIHDLTVGSAAALLTLFWPELGVWADGPRLKAAGGGLNVLNGCEGIDMAFLLAAALLVAPLTLKWRVLGLAVGLPLVFALNQARVLLLFHLSRNDRAWFEWVHGLLGPLVLAALVMAFFLFWMHLCAARTPGQPGARASP